MPIVSTAEHYDRLIDEIDDPVLPQVTDPYHDTGALCAWMELADSPAFWAAVGEIGDQRVLEVGVGTGRVARKLLARGCAAFIGIDISAKSIARAQEHLAAYPQAELLQADITDFCREGAFDLACLAWTVFHLEDKPRAFANIFASLAPGGRLVCSLEVSDEWLDYGPRQIRQYPIAPEALRALLVGCGFVVDTPMAVYDTVTSERSGEIAAWVLAAVRPPDAAPARR